MAPRVFAVCDVNMDRWFLKMHWGVRVYERLGIKEKYIMVQNTNTAIEKVLSEIS